MPKSYFLDNAILDHQLGGPDYVRPATVWIALMTTSPTPAGGGVEVAGGSYVRVAVTNNSTNFPAASGSGLKSNGTTISFVTPTAGWGLVPFFAIYDASSGGNLLRYGNLTIPKTIDQGDIVSFPPGELDCTES